MTEENVGRYFWILDNVNGPFYIYEIHCVKQCYIYSHYSPLQLSELSTDFNAFNRGSSNYFFIVPLYSCWTYTILFNKCFCFQSCFFPIKCQSTERRVWGPWLVKITVTIHCWELLTTEMCNHGSWRDRAFRFSGNFKDDFFGPQSYSNQWL